MLIISILLNETWIYGSHFLNCMRGWEFLSDGSILPWVEDRQGINEETVCMTMLLLTATEMKGTTIIIII